MLDFLKDKGYKHHNTSGDHIELKPDNGKIASVFAMHSVLDHPLPSRHSMHSLLALLLMCSKAINSFAVLIVSLQLFIS